MEEKELDPPPLKEEVGAVAEAAVPDGEGGPGSLVMMQRRHRSALPPRNSRGTAATARKRVTRRPIAIPRNAMKLGRQAMLLQHQANSKEHATTAT